MLAAGPCPCPVYPALTWTPQPLPPISLPSVSFYPSETSLMGLFSPLYSQLQSLMNFKD